MGATSPVTKRLNEVARRHATAKGKVLAGSFGSVSANADRTMPDDPVLLYIRASSAKLKENENNRGLQNDSPDLQRAAIREFCNSRGYNEPHKVFVERKSAKRFDWRAVYSELKAYIADNPRADKATVVFYDIDRFTRELDENDKPNLPVIMKEFGLFQQKGWHVDFATTPMERGADLMNYIMLVIKAWGAADYVRVLGERIRAARVKTVEAGRLVSGKPPYPACRLDALTKRPLKNGEWSANGSVLGRDDRLYPTWVFAAKKIAYEGWSPGQVAVELARQGAPLQPWQKGWSAKSVRRMLQNTSLIAQPVVFLRDKGEAVSVKADWEPIVDKDLFLAANARLRDEFTDGKTRMARSHDGFLLEPVCEACGAQYYPHVWSNPKSYPGVERRRYVHRAPSIRSGAAEGSKFHTNAKACGCRSWSFPAAEAEDAVRKLIADYRTSAEFVSDMIAQRRAASSRLEEAREFEAQRYARLQELEADYNDFCENIGRITNKRVLASLGKVLEKKEAAVEAARQQWLLAQQEARTVSGDGPDIRERVNFTKQILDVWEKASEDERRTVLSWWVDAVLVKQGTKKGKRGNAGSATIIVALRTNPERPYAVLLNAVEEDKAAREAGRGIVGKRTIFSKMVPSPTMIQRFEVLLSA